MPGQKTQLTREQVAMIEAGRTAVTPSCAAFICAMFLVLIFVVPLWQWVADPDGRAHQLPPLDFLHSAVVALRQPLPDTAIGYQGILSRNRQLLRTMRNWETELEDNSRLGRLLRPLIQYFITRWLGAGNEQVYPGNGCWLFYRPDVDCLTTPGFLEPASLKHRVAADEWITPPHPDPRPALLDFYRQMEERGIRLLLVPIPTKTMIHPEHLAIGPTSFNPPLYNRSFNQLVMELKAAGMTMFDPAPVVTDQFRAAKRDAFLATDTHWHPDTMELTAIELARFIRANNLLPDAMAVKHIIHKSTVTNQGDIVGMLQLPARQDFYRPEIVEVRQVLNPAGNFWRPTPDADVLILGDSFCNIYSLAAMGWGESAGFAEHLSMALARPLDCILINDNAAYAPRAILQRELARGRDRLAGKKLVVYMFAARELSFGDWRVLPLESGTPRDAGFICPPSGAKLSIRGVIVSISAAPRPGAVPYRDHLISMHLADISGANVSDGSQALAYTWSMRDNVITPAARLRAGETVEVELMSWDDVANKLDGINRSEPDDFKLQLQPPCWADSIKGRGFTVP